MRPHYSKQCILINSAFVQFELSRNIHPTFAKQYLMSENRDQSPPKWLEICTCSHFNHWNYSNDQPNILDFMDVKFSYAQWVPIERMMFSEIQNIMAIVIIFTASVMSMRKDVQKSFYGNWSQFFFLHWANFLYGGKTLNVDKIQLFRYFRRLNWT